MKHLLGFILGALIGWPTLAWGLIITDVQVDNGKAYQVVDGGVVPGARVYIDRSYTLTTIPPFLRNATFIQTANDDKSVTTSVFLEFMLTQPATVYIAYDQRVATPPSWISIFEKTSDTMASTDTTFDLYRQDYPAGPVVLGGNASPHSMYSVVVTVSQDDMIPPSPPTHLGVF